MTLCNKGSRGGAAVGLANSGVRLLTDVGASALDCNVRGFPAYINKGK